MRTKKNYCLAIVALLFTACIQYPDDVTVTINESGYINVKVVDNDNKAIEGAMVEIYWSSNVILKGITDASGMYIPEKMLQGSYYCVVSYTKREIEYQERKEVQVIAGEYKTVTINPFANSGNLNIQLESPDGRPVPELNVLILPRDFYRTSIDECIAAAFFTGKVDSQKKISFVEIPTGNYRAWIYDDDKKIYRTYDSDSYIQIERGKTKDRTIRVDLNI